MTLASGRRDGLGLERVDAGRERAEPGPVGARAYRTLGPPNGSGGGGLRSRLGSWAW
jgi:hypothetical protein